MPGRIAARIALSRVAMDLVMALVLATMRWLPLARLENIRGPVVVTPELKPVKLALPRETLIPLVLPQQTSALRCTPRVMSLLVK